MWIRRVVIFGVGSAGMKAALTLKRRPRCWSFPLFGVLIWGSSTQQSADGNLPSPFVWFEEATAAGHRDQVQVPGIRCFFIEKSSWSSEVICVSFPHHPPA